MDVHNKGLPKEIMKPTTDAQRAGYILRNKLKYLKGKANLPPEVCALLEEIECRTSVDTDATTCRKVMAWMDAHENSLPKEFMKPTTDAQRAEYLLRNKFQYIKCKTDHPSMCLVF